MATRLLYNGVHVLSADEWRMCEGVYEVGDFQKNFEGTLWPAMAAEPPTLAFMRAAHQQ